ncbi:PQ loop repeat-domain-containing protein [Gymnopilus junonius]|uniref:PQ loop repeat-domain-containing protein n=1 Tax=Gymnopilus junonius TaxID=109634 RepID=A0A9P5NYW0_GYMJU|nr:PQ loop repeat-domain-containing protein [Gymnopilus junonius]
MLEALSLSDILGYASIGCWLGAQFPQVIENIKLQSCEGLALPFLANWLLGDISNLVGCILTHQLPFQTWLATYFVLVDFTLVAQYAYYYKPAKGPSSILSHIRSATSPAAIRRLSIDRGASRYRTLSAVASNVAAAAALAAKQDEQQADSRTSHTRYSRRTTRLRGYENQTGVVSLGLEPEEGEAEPPTALIESFHSERGGDYAPKRVSWSIERTRGRASSVGQAIRATTPTAHNILSNESLVPTGIFDTLPPAHRGSLTSSAESLTPAVNNRSSRASRKGSTMVFLGAWALFGFGTLAHGRTGMTSPSATNVGRVLSTSAYRLAVPVTFTDIGIHARDTTGKEFARLDITLPKLHSSTLPHEEFLRRDPHHEEPTPEQVLGRIFAWLCTTLYLTSRLPQIWKNYTRKSVEGLSMYLFIFAFLGNTFYASSILSSPRRFLPPPESTDYIRESIPYLLGSVGTLLFDITIVSQSFCYRHRHRRHSTLSHARALDEEEAGLLSGDALSAHPAADSSMLNRGRTSGSRSIA